MDFFASFEQGMDQQLGHYLSATAASLCALIAPAVFAGLTIYLILIGYAVMRGEHSASLMSSLWKVVKWAIICAAGLSAGGFNTYIVGGLSGIEATLFQATTGSTGGGALLDSCLSAYIGLFNQLIQTANSGGPVPNLLLIAAILLLAAGSLIFFGLAVCVFILAKVAGVLVIALGPAFIATLLFPPVQRFADAWLSAVLNTIILKVLAAMVLAISTLFLSGVVNRVTGGFDQTAVLMDCLKILLLSVGFGFLFAYLPMLSASLVGGAPMPSLQFQGPPARPGGKSQARDTGAGRTGGTIGQKMAYPVPNALAAYRRNVISHLTR